MYQKRSLTTMALATCVLFLFVGMVFMAAMPSSVLAENTNVGELPVENPPIGDGEDPPDSTDGCGDYGDPNEGGSSILESILESL